MAHDLIDRLQSTPVVDLSAEELDQLLLESDVVRQVDTGLSGAIRIAETSGRVLVQEQTPDGEILIRLLPSRAEAERFVDDRLDAYERMWDG